MNPERVNHQGRIHSEKKKIAKTKMLNEIKVFAPE